MSPDLEELGQKMKRKWQPITIEKKFIEIDQEIYKRRIDELAELFYDAFCELHKNRSVEPELTRFCDEQGQRKAG